MAEIDLPADARIAAMHIEPWHPGQIALESPFTGSVQVLNRGPASWRGSAEFAVQDDAGEVTAQAMEAFFASLDGQGNWVALPLNRPTVATGNEATVSSLVNQADGTLIHRLSSPLEGLQSGHWLKAQGIDRVFIVRSIVNVSVTLDPQIPLAIGAAIEGATTIRARAQSARARPMRRTPDFWTPPRLDWAEYI